MEFLETRIVDLESNKESSTANNLEFVPDDINNKMDEIDLALDDLEQYSRRNCLRFFGIKEASNEKADDIILKLANDIGVDLTLDDIERSHRVGRKFDNSTKPRPIIVKFCSYRKRNDIIKSRRRLKGSGKFIHEDLTYKRQILMNQLRQKTAVLAVWSIDGRIFASIKKNGKEITQRVLSINDI
ncbi:uncharacterized protein LOC117122406 [Anneissia japonica]|uniref:uncharacterized protein LOC117122406 n=1 Tax=Anneissia japonica TaxID=1529436 RepID=UPI0014256BA5|nr:uncharacterized protein LOC117122406 [Anneissia japonica]